MSIEIEAHTYDNTHFYKSTVYDRSNMVLYLSNFIKSCL